MLWRKLLGQYCRHRVQDTIDHAPECCGFDSDVINSFVFAPGAANAAIKAVTTFDGPRLILVRHPGQT